MWLGKDPAIIRDPACIAYLIYTAPASKQDPAYKRSYTVHTYIYTITFSYFMFQLHLARESSLLHSPFQRTGSLEQMVSYGY